MSSLPTTLSLAAPSLGGLSSLARFWTSQRQNLSSGRIMAKVLEN